jgi:hypothetical protein
LDFQEAFTGNDARVRVLWLRDDTWAGASFLNLAWLLLEWWSMHKTYFYLWVFVLPLSAIILRAISRLKMEVPMGYEDETGFHLGTGGR